MPRSGSTWQFNLLREMLNGTANGNYASYFGTFKADDPSPVHLVKTHLGLDSEIPRDATIISSYRDVRAVAGSMVRMKWIAEDPLTLADMCKNYVFALERLAPHAAYLMPYEASLADPVAEAKAIWSATGLSSSIEIEDAVAGVGRLRQPAGDPIGTFEDHDRTTQLHVGHVGGKSNLNAIRNLSIDACRAIEDQCGAWLENRGYPVPFTERAK